MVGVLCVQHMNCWLQHLHELYECPFCLKNCFYFTDWYSTHTITEGSSVSYLSRCDCILLPLKSLLSIHCERSRPSDKEPHKHCKSCLCVVTSMYHSVIHVSCAGLYVDVGYLYVHVSVCLRGFLCLCDPGLKNRKIHREAYYLDGTKSQIPTKEGNNLSGSWVCVQVCKYVWVCVCADKARSAKLRQREVQRIKWGGEAERWGRWRHLTSNGEDFCLFVALPPQQLTIVEIQGYVQFSWVAGSRGPMCLCVCTRVVYY